MKEMHDKILVFVPGYNVEKTAEKALFCLLEVRKKLLFDILFVDNCSSDSTYEIAKRFSKGRAYVRLIRNPGNLGYGGSQKVAFRYAFRENFDYLVEYDSDIQYPAEKIMALYRKIKSDSSSIVFGSRVKNAKDISEMPKWKAIGNIAFDRMLNWAFGFGVSEIHTGFRIYSLKEVKGFALDKCHDDYRWTLDSVIETAKIRKKFSEIGVKALYHRNAKAPSSFQLIKVMVYMLFRALKFRILKE
ncbi:MAG: glycosyltransferase family 2 protein [Candidatus Woesearchaeota archaeon]|nr:glycosyltransferase family 2 protein [Candidatus Woesearchaeota archaeon]